MIEFITELDRELFLWLNHQHSPFWDTIMYYTTQRETWYPLYVFLIGLFFWQYRAKAILVIVCLLISVGIAETLATHVFKPNVKRLRPCKNKEIKANVRVTDGCSGKWSFFSAHAANTFALTGFLWGLWRRKYQWAGLVFLWSAFVAYSRIYVGVHYPMDLLAGALAGGLCGCGGWYIYKKAEKQLSPQRR